MDDDDDKTVATSNCNNNTQPPAESNTIFNQRGYCSPTQAWQQMLNAHENEHGNMLQAMLKAGGIQIAIDMAVTDAGATSHFVLQDAPVKNI